MLGSLAGCAGGQTGTEEWGGRGTADSPCEEQRTPLAPDVASSLGFSIADVVALTGPPRTSALQWNSLAPDAVVEPEQGISQIELELLPDVNSGRFVHYTPREIKGMAPTGVMCPNDDLAFDAELLLNTAGGALAERRKVVVRASSPEKAQVYAPLPWYALRGSMVVTPREGVSPTDPIISFEIDAQATRGKLIGMLEELSASRDETSARNVTYACWPAASADCATP